MDGSSVGDATRHFDLMTPQISMTWAEKTTKYELVMSRAPKRSLGCEVNTASSRPALLG
jgi:hypothetical protein